MCSSDLIFWGFADSGEVRPALFQSSDLHLGIRPVYLADEGGSTFYRFAQNLSSHMYHCVLGAEDIAVAYGQGRRKEKIQMATAEWEIPPDRQLLDFLHTPCANGDHSPPPA